MVAHSTQAITVSTPREAIRVGMASGITLEGPLGTTVGAFLDQDRQLHPDLYDSDPMGGVFNGKLRELGYKLEHDGDLKPMLMSDSDGNRIYRRSLTLLLTTAVDELFPGVKVGVQHSIPEGGYYCELRNREPFTPEELQKLNAYMHEIVNADEPIVKQVKPIKEALEIFEGRAADDKLRLLAQQNRDDLVVYTLRARTDYYFGYMLPSTGHLRQFNLMHAGDGFILRFPRTGAPNVMQDVSWDTRLAGVFRETNQWLRRLGVEDIGRLNKITLNGRLEELILVSEALHEQRVAYIAGEICQRHTDAGVRIVLIAGPSSSGKTTFSKRLAVQLLAHGIRPFTLELDNYFVDRELTPLDEQGEYDFESLGALNIERFNQDLLKLTSGELVQLPKFNFYTGESEDGMQAQLDNNQVIIIEGIHGLNPDLVPDIPESTIHRVYVSALTQLNVDAHNRVPTTDVRLLRRIVRDSRTRGYTATDTLKRWASVRRGEKRNIFPYQENADTMFNSALVYELAALRPLAEPLLLQVAPNTPPHIEANRLLAFLSWVHSLNSEQTATIPNTSLLREFIGGSNLTNYHPDTLDS